VTHKVRLQLCLLQLSTVTLSLYLRARKFMLDTHLYQHCI